jgi:hypothetical protein
MHSNGTYENDRILSMVLAEAFVVVDNQNFSWVSYRGRHDRRPMLLDVVLAGVENRSFF